MKFASANFYLNISQSEIYRIRRIYRIGEADISPPSADGAILSILYRTLYLYAHIKLSAVGDSALDVPSSTKVDI